MAPIGAPAITIALLPVSGDHQPRHLRVPAISTAPVSISGDRRRRHLMVAVIAAGRSPINIRAAPKMIGTGWSRRDVGREIAFSVTPGSKGALGAHGGNGGHPPVPPNAVSASGDGGVPEPSSNHHPNIRLLITGALVIAGLVVMYAKSGFTVETLKAEAADKFKTFCYSQTYTAFLHLIVNLIMYIFIKWIGAIH